MAEIAGIGISGMITPGGDDRNKFATHSDQFGKGGYRAVQTIEDRDAITYDRRTVGMEVRVLDEGVVYYLESFEGSSKKGVTSQVWKVATAPAGENTPGSSEKEVFIGFIRDGRFWETDEIEIEGKTGCIYLDTTTNITYHYNESKRSFDKINTLSWVEVL